MTAKAADAAGSRDELASLLAACEAARDAADYTAGERHAREARALAQACGDPAAAARAATLLTLHVFRQGRLEEAVQFGRAALPEVDLAQRPEWSIELRNTLTQACNETGLTGEALACALEALQRARTLGSPRLLSWSLNRLGCTYEAIGNFDRALEHLHEAVDVAQECGENEPRFAAHMNMAVTLMQRIRSGGRDGDDAGRESDARRALQAVRSASALCGEHPHQRMYCCGVECGALLEAGELDAMRDAVERYRALAQRSGMHTFAWMALLYEAEWLIATGAAEQACALLDERIDEADLRGRANQLRRLLDMRHRAHKARGAAEPALAAAEALLALERREARERQDAHNRALLRELEVQNARHEAQRLRRRAGELEARAAAAAKAALEDSLTGLANRRALDLRLAELLPVDGAGPPRSLHVAMIDIDHFKAINDNHGHAAGDGVLRELARLLRESTRAGDLVARCGGEEFVLVLTGSETAADEVCERLRLRVAHHDWAAIVPGLRVTVSIGLARAGAGEDAHALCVRADAALYAAKRGGRNRLVGAGLRPHP
ncbi:diguanylate cyclase domain-containing protein [Piscinibacter sp.]|uniref:GGDEF domain-containing protein n=1 Tax=Piscinibacter sp. TaxID=1903157 RepID=UPI0039E31CC6